MRDHRRAILLQNESVDAGVASRGRAVETRVMIKECMTVGAAVATGAFVLQVPCGADSGQAGTNNDDIEVLICHDT